MIEQFPGITSENETISRYLKDYQSQANPGSLSLYLRNAGVRGSFMLFNMVVSYNGGDFMDLVKQSLRYNLSPVLTKVSTTVAYKEGSL